MAAKSSPKKLKIQLVAKTPYQGSGPRGVDLYATNLFQELSKKYPHDHYQLTRDQSKAGKGTFIHYTFFDPFFLTLPLRSPSIRIVTIHDLIPLKFPDHFPSGLRGKLKWQLQKMAVKNTSAIITDSESSARDIEELITYPRERIHIIPLAAPNTTITAELARGIQAEYGLPSRYLLYVGDINWNKNIPGLIRAFGELENKRVHLVLVGKAFVSGKGTKEYREIQQSISESGAMARIHLLGFVPSHHLPALYHQATLYVQPSWYEGFGFPILEALMQECPVLSSCGGSLPEVGGEYAHYFDPTQKRDLIEKLNELLSDSTKRTRHSIGGKIWAKRFSWEKVAETTHQVYEDLSH